MAASATYFEDVALDERVETPAMTITEAHVGLYAGLSGDGAAEPGVVPDLLPLCLSTGLGWRLPRPPLVVLAFLGFEWEFVKPVHVGDTVRSRSRTASKRPMRDGGLLVEHHEIVDQRGDVVQRGRFMFLVARRSGPGRAVSKETSP